MAKKFFASILSFRKKFEDAAVKLVGTGPGHQIHLGARPPVPARPNRYFERLKFLDHIGFSGILIRGSLTSRMLIPSMVTDVAATGAPATTL